MDPKVFIGQMRSVICAVTSGSTPEHQKPLKISWRPMDVKQQHFNYNIRIQVQDFFLFSVSFYPKYPNFNN